MRPAQPPVSGREAAPDGRLPASSETYAIAARPRANRFPSLDQHLSRCRAWELGWVFSEPTLSTGVNAWGPCPGAEPRWPEVDRDAKNRPELGPAETPSPCLLLITLGPGPLGF